LALIGILAKVFYIRAPRWLCLAAIGQMLAVVPVWSLASGVIYTLGAKVSKTAWG
jgi:hypothetical protein